jgi:hypothetical protein
MSARPSATAVTSPIAVAVVAVVAAVSRVPVATLLSSEAQLYCPLPPLAATWQSAGGAPGVGGGRTRLFVPVPTYVFVCVCVCLFVCVLVICGSGASACVYRCRYHHSRFPLRSVGRVGLRAQGGVHNVPQPRVNLRLCGVYVVVKICACSFDGSG